MKKHSMRVGMRVREIYTGKEFTIDRSEIPPRIFRLKGTRIWVPAIALEAVRKRPSKLTAKLEKRIAKLRSETFAGPITGVGGQSKPTYKRTCLNCGAEFTTKQKKQKFHNDACRAEFWRRRNEVPVNPGRLRSQNGGESGEQGNSDD
jgi:hypothetical protein